MDGQRFRPRYAGAAVDWLDLLCVGGQLDGRRFSVPVGQRAYSMNVSASETAEYRVAAITLHDSRYAFLTPVDWTDAQALRHLFGTPTSAQSHDR